MARNAAELVSCKPTCLAPSFFEEEEKINKLFHEVDGVEWGAMWQQLLPVEGESLVICDFYSDPPLLGRRWSHRWSCRRN